MRLPDVISPGALVAPINDPGSRPGRLSPVQTQVPVGSSGVVVVVVGLGLGVGLDVVVAIRGSVVGYASSVGFPAR